MTGNKETGLAAARQIGDGEFFIIILPGKLHYLDACLFLLPQRLKIKLVFNGVADWEKRYISEKYPELETSTVNPFPRSVMPHGKVLNRLIANSSDNFGIIDYDLYLFSDQLFDEPEPCHNELAVGLYRLVNKNTGDAFPTTHFLYLNIMFIKRLMSKYSITPYQKQPPRHLRPALLSRGYHRQNFLKDYLGYFDTLNLIMAMAIHDGYGFRFAPSGGAFHLGSTNTTAGHHATSYASYRLLSLQRNAELRERYRSHYDKVARLFNTGVKSKENGVADGFLQVDSFIELLTSLGFENQR